jgi:hypothetical protein
VDSAKVDVDARVERPNALPHEPRPEWVPKGWVWCPYLHNGEVWHQARRPRSSYNELRVDFSVTREGTHGELEISESPGITVKFWVVVGTQLEPLVARAEAFIRGDRVSTPRPSGSRASAEIARELRALAARLER